MCAVLGRRLNSLLAKYVTSCNGLEAMHLLWLVLSTCDVLRVDQPIRTLSTIPDFFSNTNVSFHTNGVVTPV